MVIGSTQAPHCLLAYYICIEKADDIFNFSKTAIEVLRALEDAGAEAWLVGGCVRDAIMGRPINDIDIATSAPWQQTAHICESCGMRVRETGTAHGTVTILHGDESFEVTTYRVDSATSSDSRHPDSVEFVSSIEEDLARRDFTINAMAWHPQRGVIDPYGGMHDIEGKLVKVVGSPKARFKEDALRILRACRFASQLGFSIDEDTYRAMLASKSLLARISAERLTYELDRFLTGAYVRETLMRTVDVLSFVLPELVAMKGCPQRTQYHIYDVLEHTAYAVEAAPPTRLLRWAALCHDMGKPAAAFMGEDGAEHFYGHAQVSARLADGLMSRLLMSNSFKADVLKLIRMHSDTIEETPRCVRRVLKRMDGRADLFRAFLDLKRADTLAHAPTYHVQVAHYDALEAVLDEVLAEGDAFTLSALALNGNDLLAMGLEPGPPLGMLLNTALDAVIDGKVPNEKEALIAFVRRLM